MILGIACGVFIDDRCLVCVSIGKKFAVSSGSKCVSVCYYQAAENWWVSKIIKKHKST